MLRKAGIVFLFVQIVGFPIVAGSVHAARFEVGATMAILLSPEAITTYHKMGGGAEIDCVCFPTPHWGVSVGLSYERLTFDADGFADDFRANMPDGGPDELSINGSASLYEISGGLRRYLFASNAGTRVFICGQGLYSYLPIRYETAYTDGSFHYEGTTTAGEREFGLCGGLGVEVPAGEKVRLVFQGFFKSLLYEGDDINLVGVRAGVIL